VRCLPAVRDAATASAALLGLALVLFDENPMARVGLLAGSVALLGGRLREGARPRPVARLGIAGLVLVGARIAIGSEGATAVALLIAIGWAVRLTAQDGIFALAAYGLALALAGGVSLRLVLAFALLGAVSIGLRPVASVLRSFGAWRSIRPASWRPGRGPGASRSQEVVS
jgi:hypothetical protein